MESEYLAQDIQQDSGAPSPDHHPSPKEGTCSDGLAPFAGRSRRDSPEALPLQARGSSRSEEEAVLEEEAGGSRISRLGELRAPTGRWVRRAPQLQTGKSECPLLLCSAAGFQAGLSVRSFELQAPGCPFRGPL